MRNRVLIPLVAIVAAVFTAVFPMPAAQAVEKTKEKVYAEPNEEKAIVYVIRTKRMVSALVPMCVYADDELLGVLANNCYTYAYLDPGERVLSKGSLNTWSDWEHTGTNKRFEFEQGETYYFSVWAQIDELPRVSGMRLIQQVKFYCSPSDEEIQTAKSKVFDRTGKTEDLDNLDQWVIADWNAHHEAHIAKWPRVELSGYSILVIEDFKVTDPKTAKRKSKDMMKSAPNRVANFVQTFLAPGTFREVRREELKQPNEDALILRVELTQYKPGSKATRGLFGLGTGGARLDFNARLIDGGNGSVLATFSDERAYAWGGTRGARGGIDVIEKNLANELATYLERQAGSVAGQPEESAPAPD